MSHAQRALFLAGIVLALGGAASADTGRGQTLYETHCGSCHADSVHGRQKRVANDLGQVRAWVRRWSANLGLRWTEEELDDVSAWLNARYYRHPAPETGKG